MVTQARIHEPVRVMGSEDGQHIVRSSINPQSIVRAGPQHWYTFGLEPSTSNHLNGCSFQQDALASYNGWQYIAFWADEPHDHSHRLLHLGRRCHTSGAEENAWQVIAFDDYRQVTDDGHNAISLGLCPADGTIHLSFDLHNVDLNYRLSNVDLLTSPHSATWSAASFSAVLHHLPGLSPSASEFKLSTYPRFVTLTQPVGGLLLEFRAGMSGLGNSLLYTYINGRWHDRGIWLEGVGNNPYLNGLDVDSQGNLVASWCLRDYVEQTVEQASQQAGPNGPENNHDLCFAWSPPEKDGTGPGRRWHAASGVELGSAGNHRVKTDNEATIALRIPKYTGGILNQEAQCVDGAGGVHVVNREIIRGTHHWVHYSNAAPTGSEKSFERTIIPLPLPGFLSPRAAIVALHKQGIICALLPTVPDLVVMAATSQSGYRDWHEIARIANAGSCEGEDRIMGHGVMKGMEPCVDRYLAAGEGLLSVLVGVAEGRSARKTMSVVELKIG